MHGKSDQKAMRYAWCSMWPYRTHVSRGIASASTIDRNNETLCSWSGPCVHIPSLCASSWIHHDHNLQITYLVKICSVTEYSWQLQKLLESGLESKEECNMLLLICLATNLIWIVWSQTYPLQYAWLPFLLQHPRALPQLLEQQLHIKNYWGMYQVKVLEHSYTENNANN